jgi:hypothetical protein
MLAPTKSAEPKIVNGINVDDLFALIEGVQHDAVKGKTSWRRAAPRLAVPGAPPSSGSWRTYQTARSPKHGRQRGCACAASGHAAAAPS